MNIIITMAAQGFMIGGNVTVLIDDKQVAFIGPGQSITLPCECGERTVTFKHALKSAKVRFLAREDVSVSAQWSRLSGKLKLLCTGADVQVLD